MKKIITHVFAVIAIAIGVSSCNLEEVVYSSMTDNNFPQSVADAQSMLDGMYGYVKTNSGSVSMSNTANTGWGWPIWSIGEIGWYGWNMLTTDECRRFSATHRIHDFEWGLTTSDWMQTFQIVKNISRMTVIIDVIDKMEINDAKKKTMLSEAYCLRGLFEYVIWDLFGPVQVTRNPAEIDDIKYEARPSEEEYLSWIIEDFKTALPNLYDKTNDNANWGRFNKGFAAMFLSKIYMRQHNWNEAKKYLDMVKGYGYELEEDYFEPFVNEKSKENIYCIPSGPTADNEFFFYTIPGNCDKVFNVNKKHSTDGQGGYDVQRYWNCICMPWEFYDKFEANDVRKGGISDSYLHADGNIYTRENPGTSSLQYGAIVVKYMYPVDRTRKGNIHSCCFRYSDVLLSLAEVEARIANAPTESAIAYLKQVTDRAGIEIPSSATASIDAFLAYILEERGREFYFEGWRRDDLLRYDQYISNAQARGKTAAKDYHKRMPIPVSVVNESDGVVAQNPGYSN